MCIILQQLISSFYWICFVFVFVFCRSQVIQKKLPSDLFLARDVVTHKVKRFEVSVMKKYLLQPVSHWMTLKCTLKTPYLVNGS